MIYPYNQCFYIVLVQDVNFNENILEKNNYSQNYTKDICKFLKTSILCNASVEQKRPSLLLMYLCGRGMERPSLLKN